MANVERYCAKGVFDPAAYSQAVKVSSAQTTLYLAGQVAYDDSTGNRTVTGPLGEADTYKFTTSQNISKVNEIDRAAASPVASGTRTFTYDGNGYLATALDWDGNSTHFTNNNAGQITSVTEAYGTGVARTISITYDSTWKHRPYTTTKTNVTITSMMAVSGSSTQPSRRLAPPICSQSKLCTTLLVPPPKDLSRVAKNATSDSASDPAIVPMVNVAASRRYGRAVTASTPAAASGSAGISHSC
jgi:YD repeat-containing protein